MRFLLDTNVLEHVANRAKNWERIQDQIERAGIANCAISTITAYELRKHIELRPGRVRKENIERLKIMLAAVRSIPASLAIADAAGHLAAHLARIGQTIGPHDPLIAASAMARGLVCVTDNVKHFNRIPGLRLENWRRPAT